jgi:hypothetical protein
MQFVYELLFGFVLILHFLFLGRIDGSALKRPTENPCGGLGLADQQESALHFAIFTLPHTTR